MDIKIPKTTQEKPYIEFRFNDKGKLTKLVATELWWGGIYGGFRSTSGYEGNTCKPKDLDRYIKAFQLRNIKQVESKIKKLEKKLTELKKEYEY